MSEVHGLMGVFETTQGIHIQLTNRRELNKVLSTAHLYVNDDTNGIPMYIVPNCQAGPSL